MKETGIPRDITSPTEMSTHDTNGDNRQENEDISIQAAQNKGLISEAGRNGTKKWTPAASCSDQRSMATNWRYNNAFFGQNTSERKYNEIESGQWAVWWLHSHFSDKPESMLCNYSGTMDEPAPTSVEYEILLGDNESSHDIDFTSPAPDNDPNNSGGKDDGVLGLILDFVAAAGGPYAAAGKAIIDFLLAGSNDPVYFDKESYFANGKPKVKMIWDIDIDGWNRSHIPGSPQKGAGVQFRIDNGYAAGTNHAIKGKSRFSFTHMRFPSNSCRCTTAFRYPVTTAYTTTIGNFKSVPAK